MVFSEKIFMFVTSEKELEERNGEKIQTTDIGTG